MRQNTLFLFMALAFVCAQSLLRASNSVSEATSQTMDTMCADYMNKHWIAETCLMDTVADEWLSAKKHAYLFEIIGIGEGDTLQIAIPNYTGRALSEKELQNKLHPARYYATDITPRVTFPSSTSQGEIVYYRYFPLDTGQIDTDNIFPIDYSYPLDAALHIPQDPMQGNTPGAYFNSCSGGRHTGGIVHITHIDTEYIAGTFSFDLKPATDESAAESSDIIHITNGKFRYTFPQIKKE